MATLFVFGKIILSLILFINLFLQIHHTSAQPITHSCNNAIGNYTKNTNFHSNLNTILSSITSKINTYGFYNNTAGVGVDQVNAIAYCRGDIDIEPCRGCVNDAARNLTVLCPKQKEATIWYDLCMFRYSNKNILGVMDPNPPLFLVNSNNASDVDSFSRELRSFAGILVDQAYNGTFRKYAGLKSSDPNAQTIYGLAQCTPDITPGDCMSCLQFSTNYLSGCCFNRLGARWITPSCTFRYETYIFLNKLSNQLQPPPPLAPPPLSPSSPPPLPPAIPPPSPPTTTTGKGKSKTITIVVCVIVALLVLILIAYVYFTKRRRENTSVNPSIRHRHNEEEEELEAIGDTEATQYDFALIRAATNDFSTANLLGSGGFGDVYKGVLSNGKVIAVKRLSTTSVQGEMEFRNEVMLLVKLQHKCLVRLLGFCSKRTERLLVYEFMKNGSLDKILFDADAENRSKLDWGERYKIINSIAKGLLYLHEDSRLMIIHRDLKASNILLDKEMNAKISDFGTARLFDWDKSEANTKRIAGTMGYMAPEYAMHGLFSVKSDVYSYGVLLLEILSGKRNSCSLTEDGVEGLLSYAYKTWKGGRALDLIDPVLTAHSYPREIIMRCIHIALLCVQENVASRPTMATIILMLQSLTMTLPLPSEPGFFSNTRTWLSEFQESTSSSGQSKSNHATANYDASVNDETDSYLYPR